MCRSISLATFALGALALSGPADPQEPAPEAAVASVAHVTVIELTADVRDSEGVVPGDLVPSDLELLEDGEPRPIVALDLQSPSAAGEDAPGRGADGGWRIVVYVDAALSGPRGVRKAAELLAGQTHTLALLGEVEIVVADPLPEMILPPTRDAARIAGALRGVGKKHRGRQELVTLRRRFLQDLDQEDIDDVLAGPRQGGSSRGGDVIVRGGARDGSRGRRAARDGMLIRSAARREHALVDRERLTLMDWIAAQPRGGRRALLLVSDGYDLRPAEFYLQGLEDDALAAELRSELQGFDAGAGAQQLAELLAAEGWTLVSLALGNLGAASTLGAAESNEDRYQSFFSDAGPDGGRRSGFYLVGPLDPLVLGAEATGGHLIADERLLASELEALGERVRIAYQVDRPPDGVVRSIDVRARRPGVTVRAPRFAAAASPDRLAAARARALLGDPAARGALGVDLVLRPAPGGGPDEGVRAAELEAQVDLAAIGPLKAALDAAELRVTLAIVLPDGALFISQQTAHGQDLTRLADWRYLAPLRYPAGSPRLALVVDELRTGAWGGAAADLPQ